MATERLTAVVGARISEFKRKMAEVKAISKTIPNKIVTEVVVRTDKAQARLDRIAKTIHTLQTVTSNMAMGSLLAISPGAVPLIAGMIASLAMLGPMMGVLSGSAFALISAFALAGASVVAFGALAIPTISKLFEENAELTKQQQKAKKAFEGMKDTYKGIVKELEKPVLEAFTKSMNIVSDLLNTLKPTFKGAADAVNNLMDSLKASLGTPPVKAFFDYMNKTAGPMLEVTGKAIGNFFKGLGSMMVAFAPLTDSVAQGFLNMSQRFAEWADGLSKSEKFQSFITYVQENMPKVRAIFRDALAGITYFFSAFGPLSADMMTVLANLMSRFKEWSKTLDSNPAFQNFIAYIRENGPAMLTFISEMARLITNLAIALSPLGAKILEIANSFLNWFNTLMENHPIVGKIIGGLIVFIGLFQALVPVITVVITMFGGFGNTLMKLFPKLLPLFTQFKAKIIQGLLMMGRQALAQGARMAAGLLIAMGPVGWVIATVIALVALIIWKWKEISTFTKKYWAIAWNVVKAVWDGIVRTVTTKVLEVMTKVRTTFNNVVSFLTGLKSTFYKAGVGLIEQMIKGISSMVGKVTSTISSLASKVRDFLPFSPAKVGPLSDIGKLNFGGPISDSIMRAKGEIQSAMGSMLTIPDYGIGAELATTHSMSVSAPTNYERTGNSDIVEQIKVALGDLVIDNKIEVNGEAIVTATGKPMMQYMDKETKKAGRKGGYQR